MIKRFVHQIKYRAHQANEYLSQSPLYLSDYDYTLKRFKKVFGYELNLENPKTFNEKLNWRKLFDHREIFQIFSDKLAVREYVEGKVGSQYLNDLYLTTRRPTDIDFNALPSSFVIKANHGSGWNIIVEDKHRISFEKVLRTCQDWMKRNYYTNAREWGYKHVVPQILIERYLTENGSELKDYKIYCFNGKAKVLHIDFDRFTSHTRNFYTRDWSRLPIKIIYRDGKEQQKPKKFDEMLEVAEKLAEGCNFLRVDLYNIGGKIYFSELTPYPGAGYTHIHPFIYDRQFGEWWQLPNIHKTRWTKQYKWIEALNYLQILIKRGSLVLNPGLYWRKN